MKATNKHWKRCSHSLAFIRMQIKTPLYPSRWQKCKWDGQTARESTLEVLQGEITYYSIFGKF